MSRRMLFVFIKRLVNWVNHFWLPLKKYGELRWDQFCHLVAATMRLLFFEIYKRGL